MHVCFLQERRRAKDPEYYDRVHPGNPGQQAEAAEHQAAQHTHASRRAANAAVSSGGEKASTGA